MCTACCRQQSLHEPRKTCNSRYQGSNNLMVRSPLPVVLQPDLLRIPGWLASKAVADAGHRQPCQVRCQVPDVKCSYYAQSASAAIIMSRDCDTFGRQRSELRDVQISDTMSARRHSRPDVVCYQVDIRDWDGQKTSYTFEHHIPHETFKQAVAQPNVAGALAQDIASQHHDGLLTDRHWRCCKCGGKATRLFMHPLPYLHLVQPTIADMPGPVCPSLYCEKAHLEEYRKGLGGVLTERVHTKSVVAAVAALMALAVVIVVSVI